MSEMNGFGRWLVNLRTESRGKRILASLSPDLQLIPSSKVLELGAGRGGLLALVFERFHPARIVGTDYDAAQVSAAEKFLSGRWGRIPPSVELRTADAAELPFPDTSFDYVFAMSMLHHVDKSPSTYLRRPLALREVRRVLKPGGQFIYSDFSHRAELRATLAELGFVPVRKRSRWGHDLAIYRAPN
jgi:ubiquinone/menaquinone biosynthesis C-methylase UbiE